MKTLFLIISISLLLCCLDCKSIDNFALDNYKIKEKNKEIKLHINSFINLQENDEVILQSISSLSVNKTNTRILVCDENSNWAVIYNLQNGKIVNYFTSSKAIADSVALSGALPGPYSMLNGRKAKYVPMEEMIINAKEHKFDPRDAIANYSSSVWCAKYDNNRIYLVSAVMCPAQTLDTIKAYSRIIGNVRALLVLDTSLKLQRVLPLRQNSDSFQIECHSTTYGNDFISKNNPEELIFTSCDEMSRYSKTMFNLSTLNKYNAECTKYKIIAHLPNEYLDSKIGYFYDWQPQLLKIENSIYCCYPYSKTIFRITENQVPAFELYNLPNYNEKGLKYLQNSENLDEYKDPNGRFKDEIISKLLPLRVWKLININGNIGVFLSIDKFKTKNKITQSFYVQEYSADGKLYKYSSVEFENKNGILLNIEFDKSSNELLVFRKNKEKGWFMERCKWE